MGARRQLQKGKISWHSFLRHGVHIVLQSVSNQNIMLCAVECALKTQMSNIGTGWRGDGEAEKVALCNSASGLVAESCLSQRRAETLTACTTSS